MALYLAICTLLIGLRGSSGRPRQKNGNWIITLKQTQRKRLISSLTTTKNFKLVFARHFSSSDTWATLVSECIKNIMGTRRNPIDENDDPEDFQDEEDQEQWRQTLIYIGGALNNKFHSL